MLQKVFPFYRRRLLELVRDAGKPVLELTDDSLVPVARGRLSEVRDWIDTRLAWMDDHVGEWSAGP